jgi:hypothetical protein
MQADILFLAVFIIIYFLEQIRLQDALARVPILPKLHKPFIEIITIDTAKYQKSQSIWDPYKQPSNPIIVETVIEFGPPLLSRPLLQNFNLW